MTSSILLRSEVEECHIFPDEMSIVEHRTR